MERWQDIGNCRGGHKKMRERLTPNHGMTLIEVLLTLTIMAIASSVIMVPS